MPFFYQGNGYFEDTFLVNSTANNVNIGGSVIKTSSIDMLNSSGNYGNITNVAIPINNYDAVPKIYVDNLNVVLNSVSITGTSENTISNNTIGSFMVTIYSNIQGAPFGLWTISKNSNESHGHIVRNNLTPGVTTGTLLRLEWPPSSGVKLYKSDNNYNGFYIAKFV